MSDDDFNFTDDDLGGDAWEADGDEGFRVNFSDAEANAEAREYKVIPAGFYHVAITEVDLEESKSAKNPGKPMFAIQLTIQDGPFKGQKQFDRWCLWEGALYSVSQAMKACGLDPKAGRIPPARWWMGQHMLAQVRVGNKMIKNEVTDKYDVVDKDESGRPIKQNNIGGYKPVPADWDGDKGHKVQQTAAAQKAVESLAP